jgi:hypothetical protein
MRLAVFAALFAILAFAPGAMALDQMVDAVAVDAAVTTDTTAVVTTTTTDTTAVVAATTIDTTAVVAAAVVAPAPLPPAPVEPAVVVAEPVVVAPPAAPPPPPPPVPVAVADPAPAPVVSPAPAATPSAVTQPTPAAPQEIIVAVQDVPAVVAGAAGPAITLSGTVSGLVATGSASTGPVALAAPLIVGAFAMSPAGKPTADSSPITPLVVPIVQTLGSGLLSPFVRPETFDPQIALEGAVASTVTGAPRPVPTDRPAQATQVAADLPFGFAAPPGGWSGEGAGILALLMGFLPLGLPDGKASLTQQTQTALLLMGALLIVLPFFASPIRDRRRRGPRGFATLALRPG